MQLLKDALLASISTGLQRRSITTCSRYAMAYRIMTAPAGSSEPYEKLTYRRHPWAQEMTDCDKSWVGPKAAQMAFTDSALNRTFYTLDALKRDVLYLLPKKSPDATDFSKARLDTALEMSEYLKSLFNNTRNVGHKQAGSQNLYIRGTRSKSAMKSVPVSLIVFDEIDEMVQENLPQAEQRTSGQDIRQLIKISTPTVPDFGVDAAYQGTDKSHYVFKCPRCSRWTELLFPESLVITADDPNDHVGLSKSYYICHLCKKDLPHEGKVDFLSAERRRAMWEPTGDKTSPVRGFHINQFYSIVLPPSEVAKRGLMANINEAEEQEWHNSVGGQPHLVAGARINDMHIAECLGSHRMDDIPRPGRLVTMGVDVGYRFLHYEIDEWYLPAELGSDLNMNARVKVLKAGRVESFAELAKFMIDYQINGCVVDSNPEHRKAYEFAVKFDGFVWLSYYVKGVSKNNIKVNDVERTVSINKTSWMDLALGRIRTGKDKILLPHDIDFEYRTHMKNIVRKPMKDSDGNPTARYVKLGAEHLAHSRLYAELAMPLAVANMHNENVGAYL